MLVDSFNPAILQFFLFNIFYWSELYNFDIKNVFFLFSSIILKCRRLMALNEKERGYIVIVRRRRSFDIATVHWL